MSRSSTPLKASVVDLFCGAGGLSYGFKKQSFRLAAGIDIDEACRFPYEVNNGASFLRKDVGSLKVAEVKSLFAKGHARILVGCAPCQPFSSYNQKNDDPNWKLLSAFGRLIDGVRPDIVSMENVPQLMKFRGGETFEKFVSVLEGASYHVSYGVLYGPDFGMAQTRSRLVLVASRWGGIELPHASRRREYRTVRDAIGHLPALSHGEANEADNLHCASRLSPLNARRIASAKPGGTWRDWSADLVADCHRVEKGKGYSSVYGRMSWAAPSPTITTQFFGFGNGRFGHPEQDRALSLREGALLQGFPADYEFVKAGERVQFKKIGRLIGNAVPVNLANAIAKTVRSHILEYQ